MRHFKILSLMLLTASLSACHDMTASNQPHYRPNAPMMAMNAEQFAAKVAASDRFEIASSRMALKRSNNPDVKRIAHVMITDHTRSDAQLKSVLVADGIAPPPVALSPMQEQTLNNLRNSTDFDTDYLQAQDTAHKHAIHMFESYAQSGDNADVQNFAIKTLPTLRQHDRMIEQAE